METKYLSFATLVVMLALVIITVNSVEHSAQSPGNVNSFNECFIRCARGCRVILSATYYVEVEVEKHRGKYGKGEQFVVGQSENLGMETAAVTAMEVKAVVAVAAIWLPKE
ncbi:hypothetical protein ACH5RR_015962 [Cinchona calisaya]|uniref:Transmembrane protein n=1 Tax=Cinchona calisaya TaxID=153742 RepID=A0ABD3A025_9GENT